MEFINIIKAIMFGIVQGITEWLPISSTGHLILLQDILKMSLSEDFQSIFMVVIQLGSIMAVVVIFFQKLNPFGKGLKLKKDIVNLWLKIIVATIPAVIVGFLFDDLIDSVLYNSVVVAIVLILYGILFIVIENKNRKPKIENMNELDYKTAFKIGLFQMLALVPGTSRSGATIIGAILLGTSRYTASEFSFFLAIPAMFGASGLKLMKHGLAFSSQEWMILLIGSVVAFLVSLYVIKYLLAYIRKHNFKIFGYYRIVLGIIILLYFAIKLFL